MTVPVSIVIPVHNGRELLARLLESVRRSSVAPLEILVVDNGSTERVADVAGAAGARVIAMGSNAGFAAAVNRGIEEARGEAIALINSDVSLAANWLEVLWSAVRDGSAKFATGTILQEGSNERLDGTYDLICRSGCSWRVGAGRTVNAIATGSRAIQFCSGTAAVYRADLFRELGGFDERFESYLEDVDFGLRCAAVGRKGLFTPEAVCWHRGSATFGRWHPRVVRLIARNQLWLVAKHYPGELVGRWIWPIVVGQLLWGGVAFRHGCGWAWVSGKCAGILRFRRMRAASPRIRQTIAASERELWEAQARGGFDTYWRFYFRLAGVAQ